MSTTIDERVVEMRFDNKHFESNVKTSMSTLDKLKQSLNLTGASKGLENVSSAAKKVDMTGLGRGIEAVSLKFSALQVAGVTALANLTNSAVNAGKRMAKALTIEPVTTGFQEYETQINATQTILANTKSKGSDINDVNKALEELNAYADKTIYNFTEMTRNIGTFTAAGIDLDTSVNAIQGIANLAAVSGSNAQQASTAMYQLSQALASGTVKLMDWNSVVNAGMGGQMFQDALKETSELLGTGAEAAIKAEGSFRESLRSGWLTAEVLTETLKKFTTTGANEYIAEYTGLTKEQVEAETKAISSAKDQAKAIDAAAEALANKSGKNKEEIKQALDFAQSAEDAATKVKTFSQLWDVMKESAQSGWSQTWKLLVGDFEEAKNLLTPLADFLTGAIGKFSDARNKLLEGALNNPFANLIKEVSTMTSKVGDAVDTVKNYSEVVDKIINGDFGTGQARWDKLTEAGYDWAHAQNLVNEKLGDGTRHATEYKEAQEGVANAQSKSLDELAAYSDAQLRIMGYSDKQIKALRELQSEADKLGMSMEEFVENVDELDGRTLLIKSFKNIGEALINVFGQLKYAWKTIFPPMQSEQLYNIIAGFHKLTTHLKMDATTAIKLKDTFMGLFAAIDIVATLVGGGFRIAFNLVTEILKYFDMDILDVTSGIGKLIVKFRAWLDSTLDIQAALDVIVPAITKGIDAVKGWVKAFKGLPEVQNAISKIKETFEDLKDVKMEEIGRFIIDGLIGGLNGGAIEAVKSVIKLAVDLVVGFCKELGICSPSKVFIAIGGFIIAGLLKGISEGFIKVPESLKKIADQCVSVFENIDWGAIAAIGISVGGLLLLKKLVDVLEGITAPLASLGDLFSELSLGVKRISKAVANDINTKAIKNLAIGIGILAVALIAITYTYDKYGITMWKSVGIIFTLAVILVGLAFAVSALSKSQIELEKGKLNISGLKTSLLGIAAAIAILGLTVKLLGSMKPEEAARGFKGLAGMAIGILAFVYACNKIVNAGNVAEFDILSSMLLRMSIAMLLMVGVVKLVSKLTPSQMIKGGVFALAFVGFVKLLVSATKIGAYQKIASLGKLLLSISFSMILMVAVCKLIDRLSPSEMIKGGVFALAFVGFLKLLTKATTIGAYQHTGELTGVLLSVSFSMLLMVGVCKLAGKLSVDEMKKGGAFALAFTAFVAVLVKITTITSQAQTAKLAGTILAIAVAIGILATVCMLLSLIKNTDGLKNGLAAVGALSLMMAVMIKQLQGAKDVMKSLIVMTVAIVLLAGAVAALTLIDQKKLGNTTVAMSILMGMFSLMAYNSRYVKKATPVIAVLAGVVAAFAGILILMSKMDVKSAIPNATALGILMVAASAVLKILDKTKIGKGTEKKILALAGLVVPLLAFVFVLQSLQGVNTSIQNVALLAGLTAAMAGVLLILDKVNIKKNVEKRILALAGLVVPLLAFVFVLQSLQGVNTSTKNILQLTGLMYAMSGVLLVLNTIKVGKGTEKKIIALAGLVVPLVAFVFVLQSLQGVNVSTKSVIQLVGLMYAMTGLLAILKLIGKLGKGGLAGVLLLTAMWAPMFAFVDILKRLQGVDVATKNVVVLVGLMTAMTLLLGALSLIGFLGLSGLAGVALLTAMWVPLFAMIDIIKRISGIEVVAENVKVLIGLMTAMTVLLAALSLIGFLAIPALAGVIALTAMWVPLFAMVDIIKRVSGIDVAEENVNLLMRLMQSMANILTQLAIVGPMALVAVAAMSGITLLMGAIGTLAVAIGALQEHGVDIQSFLDTGLPMLEQLAESLGTMIGKFIGSIGEALGDSLVKIGHDIVMFMAEIQAASMIAGMIDGSSFDGVKQLLECLAGVGLVSAGMSIADIFTNILGDQTAMEKFKTDGKAFFAALKDISVEMEGFVFPPDFSAEDVKNMIEAMALIAATSVGMSFADVFMVGDKTAMEKFAQDGKAFFTAIKDISDVMTGFAFPKDFKVEDLETMLKCLKAVGTSMAGLAIGEIFISGDQTAMEKFAKDGVAFFTAIKEISSADVMTGFTFPKDFDVDGLTQLLDCFKAVGNSMIGLSFADLFAGNDQSAMKKFETDAIAFFNAIEAISLEMTGFAFPEDFSQDGLTKLLETLSSIGEYTVDTSWDDLFTLGGTSIEKFQADGVGLFSAIKAISAEASGITMDSFDTARDAIADIKEIIDSVKDIDYSGVAEFTGIGFGQGGRGADGPMHDIGVALKDFSNEVAGIDVTAVNTSVTAAQKLRTLIAKLVDLDTSGIDNFEIVKIGTAMNDYNAKVQDIDTGVVSSSITSARRLVTFIGSLVDLDTSGISRFNIKPIGDKMKAYSGAVSDINAGAINASVSSANKLKNLINSLAGIDTSGVGSFKSAIETLGGIKVGDLVSKFSGLGDQLRIVGGNMISGLIQGMSSKRSALNGAITTTMKTIVIVMGKSSSTFKTSGEKLMGQFVSGFKAKKTAVVAAVKDNITSSISSIRGYYLSFYNAGSYLVSGFATGISANAYKAAAKARAMAKAAKEAAEEALGIASPSKVFYKIGDYTGQGFVNALSDYGTKSYNAGSEMADHATSGLNDSIGKIRDLINGDLDTNPTIRPVLDLSDLKSGVSSINGMFGTGASVGLMTNVGAISASMNQRNQNGFSSEVVDAIDKLGKKLDNVGGNYYNVDGITYDDGSNVSAAVEDLTRAIRLERRS